MEIDSEKYDIEETTIHSLKLYVNHGLHPGSFLSNVIQGNADEALRHADPTRRENLADIIELVNDQVPDEIRGSRNKFENCIMNGGASD